MGLLCGVARRAKRSCAVIPTKAGIHLLLHQAESKIDFGFRRNDSGFFWTRNQARTTTLAARCKPRIKFRVVLAGAPTAEHTRMLLDALDSGELLIAEQVGVPALQRQHLAECGSVEDDLDHAFHEFIALRPADPGEASGLLPLMDMGTLVRRFVAARDRWNCRLSPFGQW